MLPVSPSPRHSVSRRLAVLCLTLLTVGISHAQAPPPAAPTGRITRITVTGNAHVPTSDILAHVTETVGNAYDPASAQKDRDAIKETGVFLDVRLTDAPDPAGGVDVTFTVSENPIVRAVTFTANTPDGRPTVPAAALQERLGVPIGQVLNTHALVKGLDVLFNHDTGYVRSLGYLFDVSQDINVDPKTGVLTVPLVETHVEAINVQGNRRVPTADILKAIRVKPGDVLDLNAVQQDMVRISDLGQFIEVGGLQLTPGKPGLVTLTIPVREAEPSALLAGIAGRVVPFAYDPPAVPFPVVQVSIDGSPPLPFLVDTGTTAGLVLDSTAAAKLGLTEKAPAGAGGVIPYAQAKIKGGVLKGADPANDVSFALPQAYVIDLSTVKEAFVGPQIAGIVGLGLLARITSRFDFQAHTLTVFTQPHPPLHLPGVTVLPLTSTPQGLITTRVMFGPGCGTDLVVDTGSEGTQVPVTFLNAVRPRATAVRGISQRLDYLYISPDLRLSGLTLGPLWLPDVVAGVAPPSARPALGINVLARLRLTLDPRHGQMLVEPVKGTDYDIPGYDIPGWAGIDVRPVNGRWIVARIHHGSPAPGAGVKTGDEAVAIDGRALAGLSQGQVNALKNGPAGRRVRLTLRRAAGPAFAVSFTLPDLFQSPPEPIDGLILSKPQGKPWRVVGIIQGSPAARAGLKVGDRITAFNGESGDAASVDRLLPLFNAPALTLTVSRAGASLRRVTLKVPTVPVRKERAGGG